MNIVYFDELDSTNDEASRGEYPEWSYIVAGRQSRGRGQRGNKWESESGKNLTFSLLLEPDHIPVVEQFRISMMAALAASDALRELGLSCEVKWSNDLYVGDKKIGGILIEHSLMGEMLTGSVVGIGINVEQTVFSDSLPNPTSLWLEGVKMCGADDLLAIFDTKFRLRYSQSTNSLHRDYMGRLWRNYGDYRYRDSDGEFEAHISEVDPLTGRLTLETARGDRRGYWFKEVEFIL